MLYIRRWDTVMQAHAEAKRCRGKEGAPLTDETFGHPLLHLQEEVVFGALLVELPEHWLDLTLIVLLGDRDLFAGHACRKVLSK